MDSPLLSKCSKTLKINNLSNRNCGGRSTFTIMTNEFKPTALFSKLPLPPTSNTQYAVIRKYCPIKKRMKIIHVASADLKKFKEEMRVYGLVNRELILKNRALLIEWMQSGNALEIRAVFFFKKERLFTKKKMPKKLDVSNRIKALHDCLSELLGIDDSMFFRVYAEKAICHASSQEMSCVEILPVLPSV